MSESSENVASLIFVAVFPALCVATVLSPLDAKICTIPSLRVYVSKLRFSGPYFTCLGSCFLVSGAFN